MVGQKQNKIVTLRHKFERRNPLMSAAMLLVLPDRFFDSEELEMQRMYNILINYTQTNALTRFMLTPSPDLAPLELNISL